MTRLDAIRRRLEAALAPSSMGPALQVFVGGSGWVNQVVGLSPQDLRDLLELAEAIHDWQDAAKRNRYFDVDEHTSTAWDQVQAILSRLDAPEVEE